MSTPAEVVRGAGARMAVSPAPTRVLVPYISTYLGGVRRVLGDGLPRLAAAPELHVTYAELCCNQPDMDAMERAGVEVERDRKSTRLNSSHSSISYAVFCLK